MPVTLAAFFRRISAPSAHNVFNPWSDRDPGTDMRDDAPRHRLQRLRQHLDCRPRWILVGEASGYQGCHVSGIPFTSERLILEGRIPRVPATGRLSGRTRPWSEHSATTVWGTLHDLGVADRTILWNAFPWHPHQMGDRQSNRTPTPAERRAGLPVLESLLDAFPAATVFAVGRHAETSLRELGREAHYVRHPSMAGAATFRQTLRTAITSAQGSA